ncbi:MAG: signal peptide peptidase SppA [Candidatus Magnetobacterium sp. LHC-1]|nr:signal peptide peptidase SppA [Nitrospirota bacterium]
MKKIVLFFSAIFIVIAVISLILSLLTNRVVLGDKIALIKVEGIILSSTDTVKEIKKYRDDPSIKAIVLSVDSPGGAVVPSAEIYDEVKKTVMKKKVVVSMGSLAASGGYYISSPASKIIANQATITGSIGVIMEMANLSGLMDKIGVRSEVIKSGRYKDLASLYRGVGKEEREILQGVLDDIHGQFIEAVAEGRKMPFDRVRGIADGRIFTGKQALELGLIDKIGTLQDAIREAADMVGIKGEPQVVTKKDDFSLNELLSNKFGDLLPVNRTYLRINYRMML